jgi:hypothetical protein
LASSFKGTGYTASNRLLALSGVSSASFWLATGLTADGTRTYFCCAFQLPYRRSTCALSATGSKSPTAAKVALFAP